MFIDSVVRQMKKGLYFLFIFTWMTNESIIIVLCTLITIMYSSAYNGSAAMNAFNNTTLVLERIKYSNEN